MNVLKYVGTVFGQTFTTSQLLNKQLVSNRSQRYSLLEVTEHCDSNSCWIVILDKVYDVTKFLVLHPGGIEIILEHAGFDATMPFEETGHSKLSVEMMEEYCIGELLQNEKRVK